jgi:hypothetical protein
MGTLESKTIRMTVVLTYLLMITTNALANILPINGLNTGQVSNNYPNLFAPAAITFSIWGLIYLSLGVYIIYQVYALKSKPYSANFFNTIGIYFSISSVANALWIVAWHNLYISISLVLMIIILVCLIKINNIIHNKSLDEDITMIISLPFSIYFGWITVATIANVTTFLVSINWGGFGIPDYLWTVVVLIVGLIIGSITMYKKKDFLYGLVFLWAYTGILLKHLQKSGFNGNYITIIITVMISILILLFVEYNIYQEKKESL